MGALIGAPLKFMDVLRILSAKSYSQLLFEYAILNSTNKKGIFLSNANRTGISPQNKI